MRIFSYKIFSLEVKITYTYVDSDTFIGGTIGQTKQVFRGTITDKRTDRRDGQSRGRLKGPWSY